jgi:IS5 family transposase
MVFHMYRQARQQFLAVAKKKRPRISKIRKAIRQQLGHLRHNLTSIDALTACGARLLAAGRYAYHKLLVVCELVRQQTILDQSDSISIPDRIVSLSQAHIRPIVRGKARCNVEFGAKISISVTGECFTFLDRLSFDPYNEGEDLKAQGGPSPPSWSLPKSNMCRSDLSNSRQSSLLPAPWHSIEWSQARTPQQ